MAGRDALARAQKAGGRAEGSTAVSKVLAARIGKKGIPVSREWIYSVWGREVVPYQYWAKIVHSLVKSREGVHGHMGGGKTSF